MTTPERLNQPIPPNDPESRIAELERRLAALESKFRLSGETVIPKRENVVEITVGDQHWGDALTGIGKQRQSAIEHNERLWAAEQRRNWIKENTKRITARLYSSFKHEDLPYMVVSDKVYKITSVLFSYQEHTVAFYCDDKTFEFLEEEIVPLLGQLPPQ